MEPDQEHSLHCQISPFTCRKAFLHKSSGIMCNIEAEEDNLYVLHFFSQIKNKLSQMKSDL